MFEENSGTAYGRALKLLSRQDYSEHGIRTKLESMGLSKDQIDRAISKVKKESFLREDRYQKNLIRKLINKGYSASFIKERLAHEKIAVEPEQILLIYKEEGITPLDQIKKLVQKKLPSNLKYPKTEIERQKLKKKLLQFVLAKGHDIDECLNHLENIP